MIRILIIQAGQRSAKSCPGRDTKSRFMVKEIKKKESKDLKLDILDLAVEDVDRVIRPCKGCVGTAGGFHCHWQCTCYGPGSGGEKLSDVMHDEKVYDRLEAADGILILTPINWFSITSSLKLFLDRIVCASETLTKAEAVVLTNNDIKNPLKTSKLEQSGKYDYMLKNHLEGKVAAFWAQGDNGADDYAKGDYPDTFGDISRQRFFDKTNSNPRTAIDPAVRQLKYSGIYVPEELIITKIRNEGNDYSENDKTFKKDKKFISSATELLDALVGEIYLRKLKKEIQS